MASDVVTRRFVRQTLETEGQRLLYRQTAAIQAQTKAHSGKLLRDRHIDISGGDDMDGQLTFTHTAYERFLDMRKTGRKRRRIHNRFVWAAYSAISERLMYGLTEDVIAEILNYDDEINGV